MRATKEELQLIEDMYYNCGGDANSALVFVNSLSPKLREKVLAETAYIIRSGTMEVHTVNVPCNGYQGQQFLTFTEKAMVSRFKDPAYQKGGVMYNPYMHIDDIRK